MPDPTPSVRLTESSRVAAFSDAVMAIVITLLGLDLHVPAHEPGQLLVAFGQTWPAVVAFLISFLRVSFIWLSHHEVFARIRFVDRPLLWLNLLLLLSCTIIPLPTTMLADALRRGEMADLRIAAPIYVLLAAILVATWLPMIRHLRNHPELLQPGNHANFLRVQRVRALTGVVVDSVAAGVAYVAPVPAVVLWTMSLVFFALTDDDTGRIATLRSRRSPGGGVGR